MFQVTAPSAFFLPLGSLPLSSVPLLLRINEAPLQLLSYRYLHISCFTLLVLILPGNTSAMIDSTTPLSELILDSSLLLEKIRPPPCAHQSHRNPILNHGYFQTFLSLPAGGLTAYLVAILEAKHALLQLFPTHLLVLMPSGALSFDGLVLLLASTLFTLSLLASA